MKVVRLSFDISILLEQTDVHWVEEELLRVRHRVFVEVLKRVLREIEDEALKGEQRCERCGLVLVRNGQQVKEIKTLLGTVKLKRVRLRCQRCKMDWYPFLKKFTGLEVSCKKIHQVALSEGRWIERWQGVRRQR